MASLHSEALAACGLDRDRALPDRDLAALLLRVLSDGDNAIRAERWTHLARHIPHGSGVRQSLLRAAGIDPHERTGWNQRGDCPCCGVEEVDRG